MKRAVSLLALAGSSAWAGDGIFGTRTSPTSLATANSPVGAAPILQMVVAVAFVLALVKWVLPKVLVKVNRKLVTSGGPAITIEETASFGTGHLYVVRVRDKTLLLSTCGSSVQCLADLTQAAEPAQPTFQELLEAQPAVEVPARDEGLNVQLEKLRLLGVG